MRRLRALLLLLALLPLVGATTQMATAQDATGTLEREIQEGQRRLEERRAEIGRIEAELATSQEALDRRLAELEAIGGRLNALRSERQDLLASIAGLEGDIEVTLARIEAEQAELERLQGRVQQLLLNLYYSRPNRNLRVLVQADSLFDLRVRNHYLSLLTAQDVDLLRALEATLQRLASEERRLVSERDALAARELELQGNQAALEASEGQVRQAVASLQSTREGQLALRRQALQAEETARAAVARAQRELEAERERLRREIELARQREEAARRAEEAARQAAEQDARQRDAAARAAAERSRARGQVQEAEQALQRFQVPVEPAESDFLLPVRPASVFSRFSAEQDYLALQAGQEGAPVYAAMSGLVTLATPLSANLGYLVTIQHAPQRCTSYLNLQGPPPVSRGSQVAQGEIIGYLGGGALIRPDVLRFYLTTGANCATYLDPAPHLGIR